jgi:response regulator RpfG family c-di-GMP phosphodiesterase
MGIRIEFQTRDGCPMKKILFVDDEPNVLAAFQRRFRKDFAVETALGPIVGLDVLQRNPDFAVVVADMRMPEMNGVEFLVKVRELSPDTVRMMLTGNADQITAIEAINQGKIFRFLNKPCPSELLKDALESAIRQHQLITAEKELLENTLSGSIKVLTEILSLSETKGFINPQVLRERMRSLAQFMRLTPLWEYETAAMLSQIGLVTIPPAIALKSRIGHALSLQEQTLLERIPEIGSNLIAQIPRLEHVARIIQYQAKNFDGTGFPHDAIAGPEIPLASRILKVLIDLNHFELSGTRASDALEKMRSRKGCYDPDVLAVVTACYVPASSSNQPVSPPKLSINFSSLRVGHVLLSDIETKDGMMIVSAGNRISPALIHRLRNFAEVSGLKEPILIEACGRTGFASSYQQ